MTKFLGLLVFCANLLWASEKPTTLTWDMLSSEEQSIVLDEGLLVKEDAANSTITIYRYIFESEHYPDWDVKPRDAAIQYWDFENQNKYLREYGLYLQGEDRSGLDNFKISVGDENLDGLPDGKRVEALVVTPFSEYIQKNAIERIPTKAGMAYLTTWKSITAPVPGVLNQWQGWIVFEDIPRVKKGFLMTFRQELGLTSDAFYPSFVQQALDLSSIHQVRHQYGPCPNKTQRKFFQRVFKRFYSLEGRCRL